MKIIRKIFFDDIKKLFTHFFTIVIAVGVCFISPLYAWCNIYSNWDPYGNTGNLKMAVVSLDNGFIDENGAYHNNGRALVNSLHENDKIDWQFVSSKKKALDGVKDGSFYGAIVVSKDFTHNMYNIFTEDVSRPEIDFYQNQKKNPVANKITDTVVDTLKSSINQQFTDIMVTTVFKDINSVSAEVNQNGGIDAIIDDMKSLNEEIKDYEDIIDVALKGNDTLSSAISSGNSSLKKLKSESDKAASSMDSAKTSLDKTKVTLDSYTDNVNASIDIVEETLNNMKSELNSAALSQDVNEISSNVDTVVKQSKVVATNLDALATAAGEEAAKAETDPEKKAELIAAGVAINSIRSSLSSATNALDATASVAYKNASSEANSAVNSAMDSARNDAVSTIDSAIHDIESAQNTLNNSLKPEIQNILTNLSSTVDSASSLMHELSGSLAGMGDVFNALALTVNSGNTSLTDTKKALETISDRLENAIFEVSEAKEDEKVKVLLNTLSGDPEAYGRFFSEPVKIDSTAIYPVKNYGSSVTPFYTALAIWVGGILLVAILKVRPDKKKYKDAKPYQLYFGRLFTFLLLGEISTMITVIGDLFLLHIQCVNPWLFAFGCAFAGLTFTTLIFSLVYAFRDVGKALAVVIVVLQIAGSSGTYPIELLPSFFAAVYKFFPFPYAINAMRECIGGFYGGNFAVYLLELSVFIVIALVIGLFLQVPFHGIMHFMEKRMEDTEMM